MDFVSFNVCLKPRIKTIVIIYFVRILHPILYLFENYFFPIFDSQFTLFLCYFVSILKLLF